MTKHERLLECIKDRHYARRDLVKNPTDWSYDERGDKVFVSLCYWGDNGESATYSFCLYRDRLEDHVALELIGKAVAAW